MARFTSESSQAIWEARWERMYEQGRDSELGPKGRAFIEREHGQEFWPIADEMLEQDLDEWDFDIEY